MKTRNSWAKVAYLLSSSQNNCRAHIQRLLPVSCEIHAFWAISLRNFIINWPKIALFVLFAKLLKFGNSTHCLPNVLSDRSIDNLGGYTPLNCQSYALLLANQTPYSCRISVEILPFPTKFRNPMGVSPPLGCPKGHFLRIP